MKHDRPAFSWSRRLTNCRGAVFLLSVYFASLLLLVLGGISLQRTMIETRAAQISRDNAQAFYLSEGALDAALARIKQEYLLDGVEYPVSTPSGTATFVLETVSAELRPGAIQRLIRRIVATGLSGSSRQESVTGYVEEISPVAGVWGNGMVVTHGGIGALPKFLRANMRSKLGAVTSSADGYELDLEGAAYADDPTSLDANWISSELRSVKNGYKCLKLGTCVGSLNLTQSMVSQFFNTSSGGGSLDFNSLSEIFSTMSERPSITGENHQKMDYNQPTPLPVPYAKNVQAATGAMTLGALSSIAQVTSVPDFCSEQDVELPAGTTTIGAGNTDDFPGTKVVNGKIVVCANSITPKVDAVWLDTLMDTPPEMVFQKPAVLILTGTKRFDLSDSSAFIYSEKYDMNIPVQTALPRAGVQYDWYISLAAKVSAPNALLIMVKEKPDPAPNRKPVVWLKPGQEFKASVYAPQSLVVVRERAEEDKRYDEKGELIPYKFNAVVGNEVIVELNQDKVEIGTGLKDPKHSTTKFLGWDNGN